MYENSYCYGAEYTLHVGYQKERKDFISLQKPLKNLKNFEFCNKYLFLRSLC